MFSSSRSKVLESRFSLQFKPSKIKASEIAYYIQLQLQQFKATRVQYERATTGRASHQTCTGNNHVDKPTSVVG
jgi:hypothetical protein